LGGRKGESRTFSKSRAGKKKAVKGVQKGENISGEEKGCLLIGAQKGGHEREGKARATER